LYGVLLNMEELKKLQAKENDTPKDLPRMTEKENQHNDAAFGTMSSSEHNTRERHYCFSKQLQIFIPCWRRGCTKTHNRYLKHVGEKH